ncbi:hypothetical protein WJX72_011830 [[Myrmecia] bisecta]|uniref:4a-hydroxytetrahydrobiopterin dehydratase n=1 Tax=[Myrmecia] bisecta TaxID=41462 RepID=A0AAW1PUJ1_9CHLO
MTTVQDLLLTGVGSDALRALSCRSCTSAGVCNKDTPKLPPGELHDKLAAVPAWKANERLTVISRSFVAKDFMAAVRFINAVADLAELEGHHPDLHIECYRDVRIDLTTHATGGLTLADFIMAAKIDAIPVAYSSRWLKKQQQAVLNMRADCFGGSASRRSLESGAAGLKADRAYSLPSWELTPPPSRKPSMTQGDMTAAAEAAKSLMAEAASRRTSLTLPASAGAPAQAKPPPATLQPHNTPADVAMTITPQTSSVDMDSLHVEARQQYEAAGSGKESDELAHAQAVMAQVLAN